MARKKRPPDDESVIRLTKKYSDISEKLRTIILQPTTANLAEHKENITEATKAAEKSLTKANKVFGKELKDAYDSGADKMIHAVSSKGITIGHESVSVVRNATEFKNVRRGAFMGLQTGMRGALSGLRKTVAETIQALDNKNRNLWEFTHAIENKLREKNLLEITYENGAHIRLDHYAKMLARSSRIETEELGSFAVAEQLGTDLVQCVGQTPTCELCAIYRDRVFSVSGKDKRFPALYEGENAPLHNGYHVIHPNCRCEFMPYFEAIEGEERTKKAIEFSNRPYKDSRTKKERDAYAAWQSGNRQLWVEQSEYEQMQRMLGDDMPYKTLGGFRRAKRDYNDAVKAGKLDNSIDLRYNNYAKLKRSYKTIKSIRSKGEAKGYSQEYIDKMVSTYNEFKSCGIELTDHSINRFLGQKSGRGKQSFTKSDVIEVFKKPPNYMQSDGRHVHYYKNIAVVIKPTTGEVITLNYREKESKAWEKL